MEVAVRPMCSHEGCKTGLRRGNVKRGTCDRHDTTPYVIDEPSTEFCPHGHDLLETGWTLKGHCFECSRFLDQNPPVRRYFPLRGLEQARNVPVRTLANETGLSRTNLQKYEHLQMRAPIERVEKIARRLGVTTEELKRGFGREEG